MFDQALSLMFLEECNISMFGNCHFITKCYVTLYDVFSYV